MVTERNWMEVYPYQSWGGNSNLPHFVEGQTFMPTELLLKEVGVLACTLAVHRLSFICTDLTCWVQPYISLGLHTRTLS